MKNKTLLTVLTASVLAFFTAWGSAGCLLSAFDLTLEFPWAPVLACALAALISSVLLSFRYGGTALLCLLALAAGYLHREGTALEQLLQLVSQLSTIYDRAYGWGRLTFPELPPGPAAADWPLAITGILIAMAAARTVVRQKPAWLPVAAALLPLCSCIVVTDTVPGEHWLLMVMSSLILLILTGCVRRTDPVQGLRLTLASALPVVLALWGLFLINPQSDYVNHSAVLQAQLRIAAESIPKKVDNKLNQLAASLQTQPPRQVDLAGLDSRVLFTYPVMEVTAEQSGTLYLRQQDYDHYTGLGWTATEGRSEAFPAPAEAAESILIRTESRKAALFLPYHPQSGAALENGAAENKANTREYTVLRSSLPENWRQTAYGSTAASPEEWTPYLSLPDGTRQEAEAFLAHLYPANVSNTAKADIIAALVLDCADYDLNSGKMPPEETDFALWFLREGERGYCVHFATAATVLLRAAGVPARYVTGYLLETVAGKSVTVTEENAHAWAEYYEPNLGLWLPLEATPAAQTPVRAPSPQTVPAETVATIPEPETTIPVTSPSEKPPLPDVPSTLDTEPRLPPEPSSLAETAPSLRGLLLLPLLALALQLQRKLRLALRHRQPKGCEPNRLALLYWQEAELLARLLKKSPPRELRALALKAKFSQHSLTAEELEPFDTFCSRCLDRLKKRPWYLQLVYKFIYAAY